MSISRASVVMVSSRVSTASSPRHHSTVTLFARFRG
jgi:hypothetical protein